ncbi:MAG: hypothetical protein ABEJ65_00660 [bacterium]
MDKQTFIEQRDVSNELAQKAWEVADGDSDKAEGLLSPKTLWVRGKFETDSASGVFQIAVDVAENHVQNIVASVLGTNDLSDVSLAEDPEQFDQTMATLQKKENMMGGNSERLTETIKESIRPGSELFGMIIDQNWDQLSNELEALFNDAFDFRVRTLSIGQSLETQLEHEGIPEESSDEKKEDEEVEIPCNVEISPTKGVSVKKLEPGDQVFVELGDVSPSNKNVALKLEAHKDNDTGLIPAQLERKTGTEAGTMRLRVKFGESTYGVATCGTDVSLTVPESTRVRKNSDAGDDVVEFLKENTVVTVVIGVSFLLFVILVYLLTSF